MKKILVIPDCQVKPGVSLEHLSWCGNYIINKKPDIIVHLGDFADLPSLSSYDVGTKLFEGRRYKADIESVHEGMKTLLTPLWNYNIKAIKNNHKQYNPQLILTLGNHCDRITRAVNQDPKLEGIIALSDLGYEDFGWTVVPFLQPIVLEGVAFCHYFPSGQLGRPITSAKATLNKMHMSCIAGHMQGRDIAFAKKADGKEITSIIAGSFYQHKEEYLNPLTNQHWRGIIMLHEVNEGSFDEMLVSLEYLRKRYGENN